MVNLAPLCFIRVTNGLHFVILQQFHIETILTQLQQKHFHRSKPRL